MLYTNNGAIRLLFLLETICYPKLSDYYLLYAIIPFYPRSVGAQYAMGHQWRNKSRKNEGMEPKQKQHPVVDVTGDGSKV